MTPAWLQAASISTFTAHGSDINSLTPPGLKGRADQRAARTRRTSLSRRFKIEAPSHSSIVTLYPRSIPLYKARCILGNPPVAQMNITDDRLSLIGIHLPERD